MDAGPRDLQARRMASLRGWVFGGVAVCGCGPVLALPSDDASSGQGNDSAATEGAVDTSSGVDESSITGIDTNDTSDTDTPADTTGSTEVGLCGADSVNGPIALLGGPIDAAMLLADGSWISLEIPPEPIGEAYATGADAVGDLAVLSTGGGGPINGEFHFSSTLSLFDRTGALLWRVPASDVQMSAPLVSPNGTVVVSRGDTNGAIDTAMFVDGAIVRTTIGFWARSPADDSGNVQGIIGDDGRPGWWIGDSNSMATVLATPIAGSPVPDGDGFIYLTRDNGVHELVHEDLETRSSDVLADLPNGENVRIEPGATASWMVVSTMDPKTGEPSNWWRIDLHAATTTAFDLTPPGGLMPLDCYWPLTLLDPHGRVFRGARDAATAQLYRLDVDTFGWDPIGHVLTEVDAINALSFGETLLVRGDAAGQTFCPLQTYEPDRNAIAGASSQLIYPASPEPRLIPPELWPSVRPDGTCATLFGTNLENTPAGTLLDLATGEELPLSLELTENRGVLAWWRY